MEIPQIEIQPQESDQKQRENNESQDIKDQQIPEINTLKRKNSNNNEEIKEIEQQIPEKIIKTNNQSLQDSQQENQSQQNELEQEKQNENQEEEQQENKPYEFILGKIEKNQALFKKNNNEGKNDELDQGIITFNDAQDDQDQNKDKEEQEEVNVSEKKIAPWIRSKTLRIQNPVLRLHNEIIEFMEYLMPTKREHQLRQESYDQLVKLVKEVIPDCEVKSFGSFTTKLYLPNGDIDLVIINEQKSNKTMYTKVAKMLMARSDLYEQVNLITQAKVPIIKFVEISSQINFDISFNALDGVKQVREIEKALKVYPEMRYLIFVLKCMLRQRDLHETFKGGIGSFLLFCMILAFLRETRRQYSQENRVQDINNISLGEYLIKFFEFYGIKNDWSRNRIIMQEGGAIIEKSPPDNNFSLISPQDSDHDIGSSAFKIRDVFNVFKNRYHFITNFNFKKEESILKYCVNPSSGKFIFSKEEDDVEEILNNNNLQEN